MRRFYLSLILSGICSSALLAQFQNVKIDSQGADDPYVCEPSIAINPKDPQNIVAASVLNNVYVTKDGGKIWKKVEVTSPFGVYGDPVVIADRKGKFYFFHLSDPTNGRGGYDSEKLDRMVVQESVDGGLTWSEGESIGLNHPKDQDKEWAAVDNKGNVYLSWTEFDKYGDASPDCHSRILFSKSKNGRRWSTPITLSETPGNCIDDDNTAEGAVPAVNVEGKVFVAWSNQNKIFLDRSYDGGHTWLTHDIHVADQPGGWDIKIPGHDRSNGMPVLMVNTSQTTAQNHLYIIWADTRNGDNDTDVWFVRSSNNGDNWTSPLKVNGDGKGKHQYLPWLAVDQVTGYIYALYYDRRAHAGNQTDVYLAYSTDSGNSFHEVKISDTPFTPTEEGFFGDYTNISAHNGLITPIWARMDDGKTSVMTAVIKHEDLLKTK